MTFRSSLRVAGHLSRWLCSGVAAGLIIGCGPDTKASLEGGQEQGSSFTAQDLMNQLSLDSYDVEIHVDSAGYRVGGQRYGFPNEVREALPPLDDLTVRVFTTTCVQTQSLRNLLQVLRELGRGGPIPVSPDPEPEEDCREPAPAN